jgi:hypothetical protein
MTGEIFELNELSKLAGLLDQVDSIINTAATDVGLIVNKTNRRKIA